MREVISRAKEDTVLIDDIGTEAPVIMKRHGKTLGLVCTQSGSWVMQYVTHASSNVFRTRKSLIDHYSFQYPSGITFHTDD